MKYSIYVSGGLLVWLLFAHSALLFGQQRLKLVREDNPRRKIYFKKGDPVTVKYTPLTREWGDSALHQVPKEDLMIAGGRVVSFNDSTLFVKELISFFPKRWGHPVGIPLSHILQAKKPRPGFLLGTNAAFAAGAIALRLSFAQIPLVLLGSTGLIYAADRLVLSPWRNVHPNSWKGKNRWKFCVEHP